VIKNQRLDPSSLEAVRTLMTYAQIDDYDSFRKGLIEGEQKALLASYGAGNLREPGVRMLWADLVNVARCSYGHARSWTTMRKRSSPWPAREI
jgi:hypothetical protein